MFVEKFNIPPDEWMQVRCAFLFIHTYRIVPSSVVNVYSAWNLNWELFEFLPALWWCNEFIY